MQEGGAWVSRVYLVIILAAIFLLILSLTPVKLRLRYRRRGKDDEVALAFSFWHGLFCYKLEVPVIKMEKRKLKPNLRPWLLRWPVLRPAFKIKTAIKGKGRRTITEEKKKFHVPGPARLMSILLDMLRRVKKYYPAIIYLLGRVHLRHFQWRTELGTGDPAPTGIIVGMSWGMKGLLLSFLYRYFSPGGAKPIVAVTPNFEKACFNTLLDCIFEVRIGYIMLTGFKALFLRFNSARQKSPS